MCKATIVKKLKLVLFTFVFWSVLLSCSSKNNAEAITNLSIKAPNTKFSKTLSNFKLQTVYASKNITDFNFYAKSWFYLDANDLMCLNNNQGIKTRTELRGLTEYTKKATKTMTVIGYLSSQPSGDVTIAQLHNKNAPVPALRIVINGNKIKYYSNKVAVKGTSLKDNGVFQNIEYTTDSKIIIVLKLHKEKITATIKTDNTTVSKTFDLKDFGINSGYYFKTGVYCQSEGFAEIKYSSITFS